MSTKVSSPPGEIDLTQCKCGHVKAIHRHEDTSCIGLDELGEPKCYCDQFMKTSRRFKHRSRRTLEHRAALRETLHSASVWYARR